MKKTHHCCELRIADEGKDVSLVGWIDSIRDHGGLFFIDLRDREGLTQVVFDPAKFPNQLSKLRDESVIEVTGKVVPRAPEQVNKNLPTGEVDVQAESLFVHNISETPPFPMDDAKAAKVNEDLRLRHRYLDLRRESSYRALKLRHAAAKAARDYMDDNGFLEIETPILFKSTPEGAREFLTPSRLNPGLFYALSQSPQQYKQMLMVAGVERYWQLARCFRDEDLRAERQPEFTQVDIEMSFIDREDMYALIEGLLKAVWKKTLNVDIPTPFPRMSYYDAMNRYGVDKPDTRFDFELQDISDIFSKSEFKVFSGALKNGGVIKAVNIKGYEPTAGERKYLEDAAKSLGAKGLAFIDAKPGEWKSPILKFLSDEEKAALKERLGIEDGDMVYFAADQWERACAILGRVRLDCAKYMQKRGQLEIPANQYNFLWVIEFPLMLFDEEEGRYVSAHHPFTSPVPEDVEKLDSDPKAVRGQHYDIVLNGVELGGGSIRIHQSDVQKKIFEDVLKIPPDIVQSRFGYMLESFKYGAPPHGGIALGFDRLCAILAGTPSIRDVIAFPKTQKGQDLMSSAPGAVLPRQLKDLHIQSVDIETD